MSKFIEQGIVLNEMEGIRRVYETSPLLKNELDAVDACIEEVRSAPSIDGNEIESLKATVYNLTLYLREVKELDRHLFELLNNRFDGMPGYSEGTLGNGQAD